MTSDNRDPLSNLQSSVERIDHIALLIINLKTSVSWYQDMLGFEVLETDTESAVTYIGNSNTRVAMIVASDESPYNPPMNQGARACHFAFRTNGTNYIGYQNRLDQEGISYQKMTHLNSQSLYFSDPDGYVIEITTHDDV